MSKTEKAEVEVNVIKKVEAESTERPNCRLGSFLSLSLNLDLQEAGGLFRHPAMPPTVWPIPAQDYRSDLIRCFAPACPGMNLQPTTIPNNSLPLPHVAKTGRMRPAQIIKEALFLSHHRKVIRLHIRFAVC